LEIVYMVRCADGSLYTGWTNNLEKRIEDHNHARGAKYTRGRLPVSLVYYEIFFSRGEALSRERAIKKMPRIRKERLLQSGLVQVEREKRVYDFLDGLKIPYEVVTHEPVFESNAAVEAFQGMVFWDIKNLFLRSPGGRHHYLVLMPYDKPLDLKALSRRLGVKSLSFAAPERLEDLLQTTPGAVSVFNLLSPKAREVVLVMDQVLLDGQRMGFHPNVPHRTVIVGEKAVNEVVNHMNNSRIVIEI